jgi:ribosomal protein S3
MGQKTSPIALRLGLNRQWDSSWNSPYHYDNLLGREIQLRKYFAQVFQRANLLCGRLVIHWNPQSIQIYPFLFPGKVNKKVNRNKPEKRKASTSSKGQKHKVLKAFKTQNSKNSCKIVESIEVRKKRKLQSSLDKSTKLCTELASWGMAVYRKQKVNKVSEKGVVCFIKEKEGEVRKKSFYKRKAFAKRRLQSFSKKRTLARKKPKSSREKRFSAKENTNPSSKKALQKYKASAVKLQSFYDFRQRKKPVFLNTGKKLSLVYRRKKHLFSSQGLTTFGWSFLKKKARKGSMTLQKHKTLLKVHSHLFSQSSRKVAKLLGSTILDKASRVVSKKEAKRRFSPKKSFLQVSLASAFLSFCWQEKFFALRAQLLHNFFLCESLSLLPTKSSWAKKRGKFVKSSALHYLEEHLQRIYQSQVQILPIKLKSLQVPRHNVSRSPETTFCYQSALVLAQQLAREIEKKRTYRQVVRTALKQAKKASWLQGVRITSSGRLGGVDLAKQETKAYGQTSLHVFSQKIDYGFASARTKVGTVGIKVWLSFV